MTPPPHFKKDHDHARRPEIPAVHRGDQGEGTDAEADEDEKWSPEFIDSVLLDDSPTIETVQRLISTHGTRDAYRRMFIFTFDKEPEMTRDELLDQQGQIELKRQQEREKAEEERLRAENEYRDFRGFSENWSKALGETLAPPYHSLCAGTSPLSERGEPE